MSDELKKMAVRAGRLFDHEGWPHDFASPATPLDRDVIRSALERFVREGRVPQQNQFDTIYPRGHGYREADFEHRNAAWKLLLDQIWTRAQAAAFLKHALHPTVGEPASVANNRKREAMRSVTAKFAGDEDVARILATVEHGDPAAEFAYKLLFSHFIRVEALVPTLTERLGLPNTTETKSDLVGFLLHHLPRRPELFDLCSEKTLEGGQSISHFRLGALIECAPRGWDKASYLERALQIVTDFPGPRRHLYVDDVFDVYMTHVGRFEPGASTCKVHVARHRSRNAAAWLAWLFSSDPETSQLLLDMLNDDGVNDAVRWRACHLLMLFCRSQPNVETELLRHARLDGDPKVREVLTGKFNVWTYSTVSQVVADANAREKELRAQAVGHFQRLLAVG